MAVNHADGTTLTSVFFYPIAAGVGAAHAGAGWFTVLFILLGLAAGVGVFLFGRKPVYAISQFGMNLTSKMHKGWLRQVVTVPFFLCYLILPFAMVWGGAFGLWAGSIWVVRHLL